jgi:FkbH-like protein
MQATTQPAQSQDSIQGLRAVADPMAPFPEQLIWLRRLKRMTTKQPPARPLRVALMGDGTLHFLADTLRLWLALEGFQPDVYTCAYGSFRQEILDPESAFYAFHPDIVWLFATERDLDLQQVSPGASSDRCEAAIVGAADEWRNCWQQIRRRSAAIILQNNFESSAVRTFGHYEAAVPWSRSNLVQRVNSELSNRAAEEGVTLFDLNHIANTFGLSGWREDRHWYQSKQPFAPNAFGLVAFNFARLVGSMKGTMRKCIVLDLDNTLWGGVIGDDGIDGIQLGDGPEGEAFIAFQDYLKSLAQRGILLAVCSKNDAATAKEPFIKHPAMRLRLEDISCFSANWENKAGNLRDIARSLNIGLDSLVFVDDSPAERELVRSELPEVAVVSLPEDPSGYIAALAAGCYFETTSFTSEDEARVRLYNENSLRESAMNTASDLNSFLSGLDMEATTGLADSYHLPRMAQLLAKTNQFHLTTTRQTEPELLALSNDPKSWLRWFSLRDRFGDHGLISVAILRAESDAWIIDTWAMSCRVFSRGMEEFILIEMVAAAREAGAERLIGLYKQTAKNAVVADLYGRLGFAFDGEHEEGAHWVLDLSSAKLRTPFIRRTKKGEVMDLAVAR